MRMRTLCSSTRPSMVVCLLLVGLLTSCGRPAPEETAGPGDAPDPAAESIDSSDRQTTTVSSGDTTDVSPMEVDGGTDDGAMDNDTAMADDGAMDNDAAMAEDSSATTAALVQPQPSTPPPVIITAENLVGVVDDAATRAGVRVTSSNPVVAVTPVVETTPTTVNSQPGVHIVEAGDTLSVIAETYGVPQSAIAEANGLDDVNTLKLGQELIIPAG